MDPKRRFRAKIVNTDAMRAALDEGRPEGIAEILVAVYDIPDTHVAVGNTERQVIDRGAFVPWIDAGERPTYPFFADHGGAVETGFYHAGLKVGFVRPSESEDTADGLLIRAHYNLDKQIGRDFYSDLLHDPEGAQFSFADEVARERIRTVDGTEHAEEMWPTEFSQVGYGAQTLAHLVAARAAAFRSAIGSHSTDTSDGAWDGPAQEKNLPSGNDGDGTTLRKAYAWVDPEGDANTKASYKFIHHFVSSDGAIGAASTKGCSTGIGVLNGGRGGTTIPDGDRRGVYNHMIKHLRDSGVAEADLPELDGGSSRALLLVDVIARATDDPDFADALAAGLALRHAYHGDKVPPKPTSGVLKEWLKDDAFREKVRKLVGAESSDDEGDSKRTRILFRAFSIDDTSSAVWKAFRDGFEDPDDPYGCWPYDILVNDADGASGYVIADADLIGGNEDDLAKIPWTRDADGDVDFDRSQATIVTIEPRKWLDTGTNVLGAGQEGDEGGENEGAPPPSVLVPAAGAGRTTEVDDELARFYGRRFPKREPVTTAS
jgi:hypothetical protein